MFQESKGNKRKRKSSDSSENNNKWQALPIRKLFYSEEYSSAKKIYEAAIPITEDAGDTELAEYLKEVIAPKKRA